jgi:hypothetical protein
MSIDDPEFYQAPKFTPEPPQVLPKQRGCFFYGCLIASVLAVLMVILVAVLTFFAYRFATQMIEEYTSTTPRDLPKVEMPAEQRQTLKERVEAFRKAVEAGTPTEPLVLTSEDLNALIEENAELKGLIYVKVEQDQVKGQVSIPLDKLGLPMVRGRYLNGEADLKASLSNGVLIVTLDSIEVNGKKVPDEVMKGIRQQNLAKDAYKDEKTSEMIRKVESLEIKDGKIVLKVRAKADAQPGSPPAKKELPVDVVAPPQNGAPKGESPKKADPSPEAAPAPKF